jgi:hypothetical protein
MTSKLLDIEHGSNSLARSTSIQINDIRKTYFSYSKALETYSSTCVFCLFFRCSSIYFLFSSFLYSFSLISIYFFPAFLPFFMSLFISVFLNSLVYAFLYFYLVLSPFIFKPLIISLFLCFFHSIFSFSPFLYPFNLLVELFHLPSNIFSLPLPFCSFN